MLPILIQLGPVKIYSFGVLLVVGLLVGLYFWWRMGRDEHWDEIALFDAFFLTLIVGITGARIGYIVTHPQVQTLYRALAFLAYPGMMWGIGIIVGVMFLWLFARNHEWEVWKVMDAAAVTILTIIVLGSVGGILNGSNPGIEVAWGWIYPGETVRRLPVDGWNFVWSLVAFGIVSRVRKEFRFYAWYKGEASVAKEGLAALFELVLVGIYLIVVGVVDENVKWLIGGGIGIVLLGAFWIYSRIGRKEKHDLLQWVRHIRLKER